MATDIQAGVSAAVEGDMLVIRVPMNRTPQPSATGKTLVVASSRGNVPTEVKVQGRNVIVGVNAYIKR